MLDFNFNYNLHGNDNDQKKFMRAFFLGIGALIILIPGVLMIVSSHISNKRQLADKALQASKSHPEAPVCKHQKSVFFDQKLALVNSNNLHMTVSGNYLYFVVIEEGITSKKLVLYKMNLSPEQTREKFLHREPLGVCQWDCRTYMKVADDGCLYFATENLMFLDVPEQINSEGFVVFKFDPDKNTILYKRVLPKSVRCNGFDVGKNGKVFLLAGNDELIGIDTTAPPNSPLMFRRKLAFDVAVLDKIKQEIVSKLEASSNAIKQFEENIVFYDKHPTLSVAPDGTLVVCRVITHQIKASKRKETGIDSETAKRMNSVFCDQIQIMKIDPSLESDRQIFCTRYIPFDYPHDEYDLVSTFSNISLINPPAVDKNGVVYLAFNLIHPTGNVEKKCAYVFFFDLENGSIRSLKYDDVNVHYIKYSQSTNMLRIVMPSDEKYKSDRHIDYKLGVRILNIDCDSLCIASDEVYWKSVEDFSVECAAEDEMGLLYVGGKSSISGVQNKFYRIIGVNPVK